VLFGKEKNSAHTPVEVTANSWLSKGKISAETGHILFHQLCASLHIGKHIFLVVLTVILPAALYLA